MKIEEQVISLKQASKLKNLGIIQKTLFYWLDREEKSKLIFSEQIEFMDSLCIYSAFSVAELNKMLGIGYISWQFKKPDAEELIWIATRLAPKEEDNFSFKTYESFDRIGFSQSDALAKLLIACIDVQVPGFEVEDINQRLLY